MKNKKCFTFNRMNLSLAQKSDQKVLKWIFHKLTIFSWRFQWFFWFQLLDFQNVPKWWVNIVTSEMTANFNVRPLSRFDSLKQTNFFWQYGFYFLKCAPLYPAWNGINFSQVYVWLVKLIFSRRGWTPGACPIKLFLRNLRQNGRKLRNFAIYEQIYCQNLATSTNP